MRGQRCKQERPQTRRYAVRGPAGVALKEPCALIPRAGGAPKQSAAAAGQNCGSAPAFAIRPGVRAQDGSTRRSFPQGGTHPSGPDKRQAPFVCADADALREELEALRSECARLRAVVDMTGDLLFEYNIKTGEITCFGQAAARGGSLSAVARLPDAAARGRDAQAFLALLRSAQSSEGPVTQRLRLRRDKNVSLWHEVTAALVAGEGKIVGRATDIDRQVREVQTLTTKAERDSLTGIYNNTTVKRLIARCLICEPEDRHLLMVVDLDNFKSANDTLGHAQGDWLLRRAAGAIRHCFRGSDVVGRLGGDEFIVLMRHAVPLYLADEKARQLCAAIKAACALDGFGAVTASVGAAVYPDDAANYETLFRQADAALYRAKRMGRDRVVFYGRD